MYSCIISIQGSCRRNAALCVHYFIYVVLYYVLHPFLGQHMIRQRQHRKMTMIWVYDVGPYISGVELTNIY